MNDIPGIRWCPTSSSAAKNRLRGGLLILAEQLHVGPVTLIYQRKLDSLEPQFFREHFSSLVNLRHFFTHVHIKTPRHVSAASFLARFLPS